MKKDQESKIDHVSVEELMAFWRDVMIITFISAIPALLLYYPVGEIIAGCFGASLSIFILNAIACGVITWIKRKKSLDKYPELDQQ